MTMVTGAYARPLQGISQQDDEAMRDGQCRDQINMEPDVVRGLVKRTGSQMQHLISGVWDPRAKFHSYSKNDELYFMQITPISTNGYPSMLVVDGKSGRSIVPNVESGVLDYISTDNPAEDLKMVTIGDTTIITNSKKIPRKSNSREERLINTALVPVLFADYGKTYKIWIDDVLITEYTTPDGSQPGHIHSVDTNFVAQQLYNNIGGVVAGGNTWKDVTGVIEKTLYVEEDRVDEWYCQLWVPLGDIDPIHVRGFTYEGVDYEAIRIQSGRALIKTWYNGSVIYPVPDTVPVRIHYWKWETDQSLSQFSKELVGNQIRIARRDGASFRIRTDDGRDGADVPAILHSIDDVSKLPKVAPTGYMVNITGRGEIKQNQYWLKAENRGSGSVVWVESREPMSTYKFDETTMPVQLTREYVHGQVQFFLSRIKWEERTVGGDENNPWPSFITDGEPIRNVGTYQNRLFFLAGEAFVSSRSNSFFDFFKVTTRTPRDDNPIDKYADTQDINVLRSYSHLDGNLIVLSDRSQFVVDGAKAHTPETFVMRTATNYEILSNLTPANTGESLLLPYRTGNYCQFRELFTDNITDTRKARPVTEHVNRLIAGNMLYCVDSPGRGRMFVGTDADRSMLYIYDYLWQGSDKVQSAWSKMQFEQANILNVSIHNRSTYMLTVRYVPESASWRSFIEAIPEEDIEEDVIGEYVRLDCQQYVFALWEAQDGNQFGRYRIRQGDRVKLPKESRFILHDGAHSDEVGLEVLVSEDGYLEVNPRDDQSPVKLLAGVTIRSKYIPPNPVPKDGNGNPMGLDRLSVQSLFIHYTETANFDTTVTMTNGSSWTQSYQGRTVGSAENVVGFSPVQSGMFPVPIRNKPKAYELTIESDSPRGLCIRGIEWRGQINIRGKRF